MIGSEPQIYFYSKRRAATGYVYTYEMMKDHPYVHQFQEEMIKEIEQAAPGYVVFIRISSSWYATRVKQVDEHIFEWFEQYSTNNYKQVGVVDIPWPQRKEGIFCWDSGGVRCKPRSRFWIAILKRKGYGGLPGQQ